MRRLLLSSLFALGIMVGTTYAEVPGMMTLQGRVIDSTGTPIDSTVAMTFTLYADRLGTMQIWQEVQPGVTITDGRFDVLLGNIVPLTATVLNGSVRWLRFNVGVGPESNSPIPITSSAYAQRASHADTATFALGTVNNGWIDNGGVIHPETLTDSVGIGTDDPIARLDVVAPLIAVAGRTEGDNLLSVGVYGYSDQGGTGVFGQSSDGRGVYGSSPNAFAGYFEGPKSYFSDRVGIGTTNPQRDLDVRGDSIVIYGQTSGSGTSAGVMGVSTASGTGVAGSSSSGYGGYFDGGTGIGVYGESDGSLSTYFISNSGTAVYGTSNTGFGGYFQAPKNYFSGNVGIGAPDPQYKLDARGSGTVVYGETSGGGGGTAAVKGVSTASGTGVLGSSESGIGVYGYSNTGYGAYFTAPKHYFSGLLGLGTTNPTHRLSVDGSVAFQLADATKYHVTYYNGGLNFSETSVANYRLNIENGGNVGIGTGDPQEKLHVAGNAKINGTLIAGGFENDVITKANILDEVGIASAGADGFVALGTAWSSYLTRQVTVPTAGYLLAIAFAHLSADHGLTGKSEGVMGISSEPDDIDGGRFAVWHLNANADAGLYSSTLSCQRLFYCPSAGTYTYYMIAHRDPDNSMSIRNRQLDLLFIPTVYASTAAGQLSESPRTSALPVADAAEATAGVVASDRSDRPPRSAHDSPWVTDVNVDMARMQSELAALRDEVAALKSQMATEP